MYGYITLDKLNMYFKDHVLYRAFYCGNCLLTKKMHGGTARLTTNYDMTFMQVLLHSFLGPLPEYDERRCVFSPKKKLTVRDNPLMRDTVDLNILFAYHKLNDDVTDGGGAKKRLARSALKRPYARAKKRLPECDGIITEKYGELRELEKENCASIDRAAHPFSEMLRDTARAVAKDKYTDRFGSLCYNIGKYIYLMDALDDIGEDSRSGNYNPFLARYPDFSSRSGFFSDHGGEIGFVMNSAINTCIRDYQELGLTEGKDLLDNIIHRALRKKYKELISSKKKLKAEKL
jgi:hypothetical protein